MGRIFKGITAGVAALILVAGSLGAAEATSRIQNLAALQYSGGEGLFVAFLRVSTNDRHLDATLIVPHLNEALHPIATYTFSGQVVFKFAAKGKGVQAAGEQIHAVVTDLDPSNGTSSPGRRDRDLQPVGHSVLCVPPVMSPRWRAIIQPGPSEKRFWQPHSGERPKNPGSLRRGCRGSGSRASPCS